MHRTTGEKVRHEFYLADRRTLNNFSEEMAAVAA